jgi:hypothetical protein
VDSTAAVNIIEIGIISNDLALVVDTVRESAIGGPGVVESGEGAIAVKEAVRFKTAVLKSGIGSDDLPRVVDAEWGATVKRGIERGVSAAAVKEGVPIVGG